MEPLLGNASAPTALTIVTLFSDYGPHGDHAEPVHDGGFFTGVTQSVIEQMEK